jgi:replicative superfamily II helicase
VPSLPSSESLTEILIERQLAITSISSTSELTKTISNGITNLIYKEEKVKDVEDACSPSSTSLSSIEIKAELVQGWVDIDTEETIDEFNANEYAAYIFKYYRERESTFIVEDYLKNQPNINKQMRHLLVDWMVEVQQQLEFNHEVLYLSVKLLDLYLNSRFIEKEKLQLLGGASMFIACKFEVNSLFNKY